MRPGRLLLTLLVLALSLVAYPRSASAGEEQPVPTSVPTSDDDESEPDDEAGVGGILGTTVVHEVDASDGKISSITYEQGDLAPDAPPTTRSNTHSWIDDCRFDQVSSETIVERVYKGETGAMPNPRIDGEIVSAEEASYWMVTCTHVVFSEFGYGSSRDGYLTHYPVGGRPSIRAVNVALESAYDSTPLVVFVPRMSPPGTADHAFITQFETWLFVDPSRWVPVSATSTIPELSVTVTATPVRNTWTGFDEPKTVVCDVNVPYVPGMESHPCTAVVKNKDPHTIRLETVWEAVYVCEPVGPGCTGGRLPSQVTASEFVPTITSVTPVLTR